MAENSGNSLVGTGDFTSKLATSYLQHFHSQEDTDGSLPQPLSKEILLTALNSVDLPVSVNQVSQLLEVSRELRRHGQPNGESGTGTGLSWGEFCVFSIELFELLNRQQMDIGQDGKTIKKQLRSFSTPPHKSNLFSRPVVDVFLGGSCNPTTWRKDIAIPILQQQGVTYHNPQVDEWHSELIEIEQRAKDSAALLFFVIDSQTRAISSMVEIAFFAGMGRDLVVMVEDVAKENAKIREETLSTREVADLNRGRAFVKSLIESGGSLLTSSVSEGAKAAAKIIKEGTAVKEHRSLSSCLLVPHNHHLGEGLTLLRQVFAMYNTDRKGRLSLKEAELALRAVHIDSSSLYNQIGCKKISNTIQSRDLLSRYEEHGLSFDDFCMVYAELKYNQILQNLKQGSLLSSLAYLTIPLQWITKWFWMFNPEPPLTSPTLSYPGEVFLGGSCGNTSWRTELAIPILRQNGVSYFNPHLPFWDLRMIPIEQEAKDNCSVLLFVISSDTLAVASMVEAAYYIGAGRKMVLCLSDLPTDEGTVIEQMKLSACAIRDYNRGRAYLASVANKNRVSIYTSVSDAVYRAVHLARGHYISTCSTPSMRILDTSV